MPEVNGNSKLRQMLLARGTRRVDVRKRGLLLNNRLLYNPATHGCFGTRGDDLQGVRCYLLGMTDGTRADLLSALVAETVVIPRRTANRSRSR